MDRKELLNRLVLAEKYFVSEKYKDVVRLASKAYQKDCLDVCEKMLDKLPTKEQLLLQLISKLKGKSVYSTLVKIQEGKSKNDYTTLKAVSSLLTHCVIEVEKGNKEFGILIPEVYEKIGNFVYEISGGN